MSDKKTYTPKQAADLKGVHPATMRRWLESGYVKGERYGKKGWWRISESVYNQLKSQAA